MFNHKLSVFIIVSLLFLFLPKNSANAIVQGCERMDLNNDGIVSALDSQSLAFRYNLTSDDPNYSERFDLNNDGVINQSDGQLITQCIAAESNRSTNFPSILDLVKDPLGGRFTSLGQVVSELLPFVLILGGMIAFLFLIWGGFRYMLAQGDPKAVSAARGTIVSAIIGLVLLISVLIILNLISLVFKIDVLSSLVPPAYAAVDIGEAFKFGGQGVRSVFPDLGTLLTGVVNFAIAAAGVVFFATFVWSAMKYMLSRGDDKAIMEARQSLANSVIGLLIVIASFAIIKIIEFATGTDLSIF